MADRIGVMHDGRLAQVGTPAEVYEHPRTRFVAEFLGAANIVRGHRAEWSTGAGADRSADPGRDEAAGQCRRTNVAGDPAGAHQHRSIRRTQSCHRHRYDKTSYAGETLTHLVRLADGTLLRSTGTLRDGLGAPQVAIGDSITLSWQPDACIVLPQ